MMDIAQSYAPNNNYINPNIRNIQDLTHSYYYNPNNNNNYEIEIIIRFSSTNSKINNIKIKCKINDKFSQVLEKLYHHYPYLVKTNNFFFVNNRFIQESKTLRENNINNGTIIELKNQLNDVGKPIQYPNNIPQYKICNNQGMPHFQNNQGTPNFQNNQGMPYFQNNQGMPHFQGINNTNQKNNNVQNFGTTHIDENEISQKIIPPLLNKLKHALHGSSLQFSAGPNQVNKNEILYIIKNTNPKDRSIIRKLYNDNNLNNLNSIDMNRVIISNNCNDNLIQNLYRSLSNDNNLLYLTIGCFLSPYEYEAFILYQILRGSIIFQDLKTKDIILSEIIGTRSSIELKEIKRIYYQSFGENLENDVAKYTSGDFKRILLALLQCKGSPSPIVRENRCQIDVEKLCSLGKGNWRKHLDVIDNILITRTSVDLNKIYHLYKSKTGRGLISAIKEEFYESEMIQYILHQIILSKMNKYHYFAILINHKLSKDILGLIVTICFRHALDLDRISLEYKNHFKTFLDKDLEKLVGYSEIVKVLQTLVSKAKKYY